MRTRHPLIALGIFVAGLLVLMQLVTTGPLLRHLVRYATKQAQTKLGLDVDFDSVSIDILHSRAHLKHIQITSTQGVSLLHADGLHVEFSFIAYLMGFLPVAKVQIDRPTVSLRYQNGMLEGLDLSSLLTQENSSFKHHIQEIKISNAQVGILLNSTVIAVQDFDCVMRKSGSTARIGFYLENAYAQLPNQQTIVLHQLASKLSLPYAQLFSPTQIHLEDVFVQTPELTTKLSGLIELSKEGKPTLDLQIAANGNLAHMLERFKLPIVLAGNMAVEGHLFVPQTTKDTQFNGVFVGQQIEVGGMQFPGIHTQLYINPEKAILHNAHVDLGGVTVGVEAEFLLDKQLHYTLTADAANFSLYELLYSLDVRNSWTELLIDTHATCHGNLLPSFYLQGRASGIAHDLRVQTGPADRPNASSEILRTARPVHFDMGLMVNEKSFNFEQAYLDDGLSRGLVDCSLFFDASQGLSIDAQFDNLDFGSVANQIAGLYFSGKGTAHGKIFGPYENLLIEIPTHQNNLVFEGYAFGNLDSTVHYFDQILSIKQAKATQKETSYEGDVSFNFKEDLRLSLTADVKNGLIEDLQNIILPCVTSSLWVNLRDTPALGEIDAHLDIEGPLLGASANQFKGLITASLHPNVSLYKQSILGGNVEIKLQNTLTDIAVYDVLMGSGFANAKIRLGNPSGPSLDLDGYAQLTHVPIELGTFKTTLDGNMELNGTLEDPLLDIHLSAKSLKLNETKLGKVNLEATFHQKQLSIQQLDYTHNWLQLQSTLSSILITDLGGTPQIEGQLDLTGTTQDSSTLAIPHAQIDLSLQAKDHLLELIKAQAKTHEGSAVATGVASLDGLQLKDYKLHLQFQKIPVYLPTLFQAITSGNLQVQPNDGKVQLIGDITLDNAHITKEFSLQSNEFAPAFNPIQEPSFDPPLLLLDFQVHAPQGIQVDNSTIQALWVGDMHIGGNWSHPQLKGTWHLRSGNAYFMRNSYRLLKARLDFSPNQGFVPFLDIEAETQVRDYDVTVQADGLASSPRLSFNSRPYLSQSDAAALLTLGFTPTDFEGSKVAGAVGLQVLGAYSNIGQYVKRYLPTFGPTRKPIISDVQITSLFSEYDASVLPALLLSMDITQHSRFRLQSSLLTNGRSAFEQRAELEWDLAKSLRLKAGWSSEGESNWGDAGADVWYGWEF